MGALKYKSETKAWNSSGNPLEFVNWVPTRGPNGGRVVIDWFETIADIAATQSTAGIDGEDKARIFAKIDVFQVDQVNRWGLTGDQTRAMMWAMLNPNRVKEQADISTGAVSLDCELFVPMSKPDIFAYGEDTALPADVFAKLVITPEVASANLNPGGSGSTASISGNYWVIAHCHEEHGIALKSVDQVKADTFTSTTEHFLTVGGKLHNLGFWKAGATGGASLANLSNILIEGVMPVTLTRDPELLDAFKYDRGDAANLNSTQGGVLRSSPVGNTRYAPVLWSTQATSIFDGPLLDRVKITCSGNSVTLLIALAHMAVPRTGAYEDFVSRLYGLPLEAFRVKTGGKTQRNPGSWRPDERVFMPLIAPDPAGRGAAPRRASA